MLIGENKYTSSQDFMTSNATFHRLTDKSKQVLLESQTVNPIIDNLDPETFEVTAKKHSTIWKTNQYREQVFREDLNKTTDRIAQNVTEEDWLKIEGLRKTQFNNRVTNISEYSNALNRGRVFTNPKFSSC